MLPPVISRIYSRAKGNFGKINVNANFNLGNINLARIATTYINNILIILGPRQNHSNYRVSGLGEGTASNKRPTLDRGTQQHDRKLDE